MSKHVAGELNTIKVSVIFMVSFPLVIRIGSLIFLFSCSVPDPPITSMGSIAFGYRPCCCSFSISLFCAKPMQLPVSIYIFTGIDLPSLRVIAPCSNISCSITGPLGSICGSVRATKD